MKKILIITMLCLVLGVGVSHASAIVWGTTNYSYTGTNNWTANIFWEVFAPSDPSSYLGGGSGITEYSYFYTITNNSGSTGSISQFSLANPLKLAVRWKFPRGILPVRFSGLDASARRYEKTVEYDAAWGCEVLQPIS